MGNVNGTKWPLHSRWSLLFHVLMLCYFTFITDVKNAFKETITTMDHWPEVAIIVDQEPGPVGLVLEGVLPAAQVRRLADVAAVKQRPRPRQEHGAPAPRAPRAPRPQRARWPALHAPRTEGETTLLHTILHHLSPSASASQIDPHF